LIYLYIIETNKIEIMNALTFKIETTTEQKELNTILNELDTIVCEIMDNEENEDNWMALKSSREALNSINKAQTADCGYTIYVNTISAQIWANQAYANVNEDRSI